MDGGMMQRNDSTDGSSEDKRNAETTSIHSSNDPTEEGGMKRNSSFSNIPNYDSSASESGSFVDGGPIPLRPPPPMMYGGPNNMPMMMMPYGYNPQFANGGMIRPPGPPGSMPPPPPMGLVMPPGSRPMSMDQSSIMMPNMERTDSDNSSIRSNGTNAASRATAGLPFGDSMETYRQNAKKSNDPAVQLDFAKFLVATADS
ncbi:hypothetical protein HDU80_001482 [Chytriomyces hyalinus]|nr:hypothetical protein HDU80_001482 [Chytriomyces hyalinus]